MGQPVTVIERRSRTPGVVRFETNRVLSGMGHDVYRSVDEVVANRPVDVLARRLFDHGGVRLVSVNANIVTVQLADGASPAGLRQIVEDLYIFYGEGVVPTVQES
jgi:hypothetical protein